MRHSKRALAIAVAGAAVAALGLAGCSADGGSGKTELRILANITPVLTKQYYEKLVQPWTEKNPDVTVTIEVPSAENVQSTLQQELASGDVPDIVASNLDPVVATQLLAFPDEKWVTDTPLAEENKADGKIWQVATGAQIQSLVFYNKDAFAKAGITEAPATIEEFTADLGKLKAAGYTPLDTAGEWVTGAQFAMLANPALLGGDDFYAARNDGKATFADSAYKSWLETYSGWVADGLVAKDALGLKYQDSIDAFTSGKAATYVMGNWIVPSIDEAKPAFGVGVFPVPTEGGETGYQMSGPAQPYSVLKASKHQKEALDLVKYLVTDPDAVSASLKSEGNFRQGFSYDGSELNQAVGAILDDAKGLVIGTSGPQVPGGFGDEVGKQVQALYVGTSASDAAKALDTWWDANQKK
ncbi:extracellular solute-binding protein [Leifsonia sp. F6_8S_P_1B]|uniref:Extracellular solute-binding protein n=1 Tax=Leifsonia williamsii TaxID=3035919 RepID=A0ABT8KAT0_9MICO|nr:extracellular solute-binding protein [Leifsonia williamsii]MDN4614556.1 extracellular solute-binding protein [Leifsonia williamsii]